MLQTRQPLKGMSKAIADLWAMELTIKMSVFVLLYDIAWL